MIQKRKITMKNKSDRVQNIRETDRKLAINFVKDWAERKLKNYEEPTRLGTAKGDPIGLSRKKYYTASMMVLYPNALKLKEIARICKVSLGVLRVWRTEEVFKRAVYEAIEELGNKIVKYVEIIMHHEEIETIKNSKSVGVVTNGVLKILKSQNKFADAIKEKSDENIEHIVVLDDITDFSGLIESHENLNTIVLQVIRILPFLDLSITTKFYRSAHLNIELGPILLFALKQARAVFDEKSMREFNRKNREITKIFIKNHLDLLSNPKAWEKFGAEKMKKLAQDLEEFITDEIDILAG